LFQGTFRALDLMTVINNPLLVGSMNLTKEIYDKVLKISGKSDRSIHKIDTYYDIPLIWMYSVCFFLTRLNSELSYFL